MKQTVQTIFFFLHFKYFMSDIFSTLLKIDGKKIPMGLLQFSARLIVESLTCILYLTIATGVIPKFWKMARVLPIQKGGDPSDLDNLEIGRQLSCLAKVLESVTNSQPLLI